MQANVKLIFGFLFLVSFYCPAQNKDFDSIPSKIRIPTAGLIFNWQTNATSLTNNFLLEINNGVVTQQSKINSQNKLNKRNYFVNQIEGGLYYVLPLKSDVNSGLIIEASAGTEMDATYSKDAYELILNGNAHYKNQKKEIGKLSFRSLTYQKIGLGLRKYFNNKTQCLNATVDFILGDQCNLLNIKRGSVFTEENGEYVDVDLAMDWHSSSSGSGLLKPKGYGAALNLNWMKQFATHGASLSIDLKDIGLVHFNASSVYKNVDTSIHFEGFNFGTINSNSLIHNFNLEDSVSAKFPIHSKEEKFNYFMSGFIEIKYERFLSYKSILLLQGNAYFYNALPMFKVSYLYNIKPNWYMGAGARVGGYSKIDFDLLTRYRTQKLYVEASIRSFEGLIDPIHSSGLGAFIHLGLFVR